MPGKILDGLIRGVDKYDDPVHPMKYTSTLPGIMAVEPERLPRPVLQASGSAVRDVKPAEKEGRSGEVLRKSCDQGWRRGRGA